jgi:ABC-type transporter Mla maintaining outer membrane lipid asymmetry ATPase subunit MlaF
MPTESGFQGLNFGAPAAERDIDKGLRDYFVESETFRRVLAGEKFVILGNRGSGKSAIFKMIAERERTKGTHVIELTPENYSYEMLSSIMKNEAEGAWAKQGGLRSRLEISYLRSRDEGSKQTW